MSTVLILGATSEIGGEIAKLLAAGNTFHLAARRLDALAPLQSQLERLGARQVQLHEFDALDATRIEPLLAQIGHLDVAVVSFGILGDQAQAEADPKHAALIANTDYTAQIVTLTALAAHMRQQGSGTIVAFSSIAGFRARRANYVYGSTKAGLDTFCQGLSDALHGSGVQVITARPGFVIGSMTEGMKPAPMSVYATDVAQAVVAQIARGKSRTLWIPAKLQILAWVMRLVPRPIWRKLPR